jgi:integrase
MNQPTGLRFGEAAALRMSDVDVPARRIRVRWSVSYVRKTGPVEGPTKNHTARAVPAFQARLLETETADRDYLCRYRPEMGHGYDELYGAAVETPTRSVGRIAEETQRPNHEPCSRSSSPDAHRSR